MISFKKYVEVKGYGLEDVDLDRDLHFDNVFGNKLRVAFPLDQNEYIQKLIDELEKLEYKVDYDDLINKKVAYRRMETKQGEKLRPQKNNWIEMTGLTGAAHESQTSVKTKMVQKSLKVKLKK